jgi:hypothetical protein
MVMKFKNFSFLLVAGLLSTTAITIFSCKKDENKPAPSVSLSAATFSGKTGETASVTATVVAPEGLKSLKITKYLGTDVDATYGTAGTKTVTDLSHTESYLLNGEGLTTPVRFKFTAEDNKGQIGSADFIVTTEASVGYLLTTFNWQWKSKIGKVFAADPGETEQILDCEKDNIYSFKADGTYTLDYGAITGTGGGTCDFDGFRAPTTWTLNAGETELTIKAVNVFDPTDSQTEVYKITSATTASMKSTQTVDLTVFGGIVYDWKFEWTAKPK